MIKKVLLDRKSSGAIPDIPTVDPQAALRYCQNLARILRAEPALSITDETKWVFREVSEAIHSHEVELSVVVPIYNEEENINVLYPRVTDAIQRLGMEYEIIFVNDGSTDRSSDLVNSLTSRDDHVRVVELARNFGHQIAISAGLDHARGKAVVVMDADLQDPPETLPQFISKWQEGYDVVYAIRERRKEGWFKRVGYILFYRLLKYMANIDIPLDSGDFCLMDQRVVEILINMPERNRFVRGIRSWIGFRQIGLPIERQARHHGTPKYTLPRLICLALDGLVSFSYFPLRIITILGFTVSSLSIILALFYAVKKLTFGLNPPGFATLTVAVFFLAGIQLITIGVIGEYVGHIFEEVKQRPLYVLRQVIGGQR